VPRRPSDANDFPDARGFAARATTDPIIPRRSGFVAPKAWLRRAEHRVPGLGWEGYQRHPRRSRDRA
jgi:hypothetical protein